MARVLEFQHEKRIGVDGDCGPTTHRTLDGSPCPKIVAKPHGKCILVDLVGNRIHAFEDGAEKMNISPVRGGSKEDPSHKGVFRVFKWRRHHTSSKFPEPPDNMEFALFYNGGEAIHSGPPDEDSHGCIHVDDPDVGKLFFWAGGKDDPKWKGGSADDTANFSTTGDIRVIVVK